MPGRLMFKGAGGHLSVEELIWVALVVTWQEVPPQGSKRLEKLSSVEKK